MHIVKSDIWIIKAKMENYAYGLNWKSLHTLDLNSPRERSRQPSSLAYTSSLLRAVLYFSDNQNHDCSQQFLQYNNNLCNVDRKPLWIISLKLHRLRQQMRMNISYKVVRFQPSYLTNSSHTFSLIFFHLWPRSIKNVFSLSCLKTSVNAWRDDDCWGIAIEEKQEEKCWKDTRSPA